MNLIEANFDPQIVALIVVTGIVVFTGKKIYLKQTFQLILENTSKMLKCNKHLDFIFALSRTLHKVINIKKKTNKS